MNLRKPTRKKWNKDRCTENKYYGERRFAALELKSILPHRLKKFLPVNKIKKKISRAFNF